MTGSCVCWRLATVHSSWRIYGVLSNLNFPRNALRTVSSRLAAQNFSQLYSEVFGNNCHTACFLKAIWPSSAKITLFWPWNQRIRADQLRQYWFNTREYGVGSAAWRDPLAPLSPPIGLSNVLDLAGGSDATQDLICLLTTLLRHSTTRDRPVQQVFSSAAYPGSQLLSKIWRHSSQ